MYFLICIYVCIFVLFVYCCYLVLLIYVNVFNVPCCASAYLLPNDSQFLYVFTFLYYYGLMMAHVWGRHQSPVIENS